MSANDKASIAVFAIFAVIVCCVIIVSGRRRR